MNTRRLLFLFFFTVIATIGFAQPGNTNCGTCAVDADCITAMPEGGLCPELIPDGQVGEPYDFSVTFFMPEMLTVTEPISAEVTLINVEITDLVNLPSGLEWSCSNPGCVYEPSSNPPDSELGCVRICGTPNAAPGEYTIDVRLLADVYVEALGATVPDQEQFYTATVTILPPDVPIIYNEFSGCGSLSDTLEAVQDFNPDQPTFWSWNIDGQVSTGKETNYELATPGAYDIILSTTVYDYVVTEFCINSITDGYCGDIEEWFCGCDTGSFCPDPYVSLLGTTLPAADDTGSNCWSNLSENTGGLNFNFSILDEDLGTPLGSPDDLLGEFTIDIDAGTGNYSFSNNNVSGTVTIDTVLNSITTDTLTVTVFDFPETPIIGQNEDELFVENENGYMVQWYLDGTEIDGATDNSVDISDAGEYTIVFTDNNGCTSESAAYSTSVGVDNVIQEATVSALYPNPASGTVYLEVDYLNSHDMQLNIMDALGRSVFQLNEAAQSGKQIYTMDISKMASGLYFVQIRLDDGTQMTQKLTIK